MKAHGVYLHGFASGPRTAKGLALGARLGGAVASWTIPDQEGGDFRSLSMHVIRERVVAAIATLPDDGAPLLLVGSSLGGYSAAWLVAEGAVPRASALLLIAPAFGFAARWRERLGEQGIARWRQAGELPFHHHGEGRELPLGVGFLESCTGLPETPALAPLPTTIVHGRGDETVDVRVSLRAATAHPHISLHLIDGDHRLTEPWHEEVIGSAARDLLRRIDA